MIATDRRLVQERPNPMKKTVLTAALLTAIAGGAGLAASAQASDDDNRYGAGAPPLTEWMSIADLATALEAQGYRVLEIEREHNAWDVEMIDANGMRVEAYLDPLTGETLSRRGYDD